MPVYRCTGVLAIPLDQTQAVSILTAENQRQEKAATEEEDEEDENEEDEVDDDTDGQSDDVEKDDVQTPSLVARDSFLANLNDAEEEAARGMPSSGSATLKVPKGKAWAALARRERAVSEGNPAPAERDATPKLDKGQAQQATDGTAAPTAQLGQTDSVETPSTEGAEAKQEELEQEEDEDEEDAQAKPELTPDQKWHEATKAELEDKLVREAAKLFARGEMWFAYDLDLTTTLQRKQQLLSAPGADAAAAAGGAGTPLPFREPSALVPLWKRIDRKFWYNEYLSREFVDAGLHAYVLPIVQGYFQVTPLPLPGSSGSPRASLDGSAASSIGDAMDAVTEAASADEIEAHLMIISRRSKERPGLRYQRRGINHEGNVANHSETEQILYVRKGTQSHLFSFVQFRGSIPLFWSQSPFSMKPPPVLERSDADNIKACNKHFEQQVSKYGKVTCINLAEQHGKEGQITEAFRKRVEEDLDEEKKKDVEYVAFDFHKECSGMRFENVSKLLENVAKTTTQMGYFWAMKASQTAEIEVKHTQNGAYRVNCLDCLDRTNVVQSAFGRHILRSELEAAAIAGSVGGHKDEDFEFVYNDTWANNGDMISQAYAGTRALKGDFTRTGKRNFFGMMNDATASVYRMVQGAVTDFFRQTVIDYVQGGLSLSGLERYNDDLAAQDPSESFRLARVRANAIDTCASMVLGEGEKRLGGWTLFSPVESNKVHGSRFEEKVVLLTSKAIYSCGYDFTSEKLSEFSKILLGDIVGIKKGLYIISPNEAYHPEDNWGMVVSYLTEEKRLNNASMRNVPPPAATSATNFLAFRAVRSEGNDYPVSSTATSSDGTVTKEQAKWWQRNKDKQTAPTEDDDDEGITVLTPRQTIDRLATMLVGQCADVGAVDDEAAFVTDETIQRCVGRACANFHSFDPDSDLFLLDSLAQAKANASLFAPLLEGLKRRLWL